MLQPKLLLTLALSTALSFSACQSSDTAKRQIENDWIDDSTPPTSETPLEPSQPIVPPPPSPTPSPDPEPTVSPTPFPVADLYSGPESLAPFVEKFVQDAKSQGLDLLDEMKSNRVRIQIGSLDSLGSGVIGLCETGYGSRTVTLDPDFWNVVSDTQKRLLMHHELGHCILYRPHRSTFLTTGREASIMYPIILSSATYAANEEYYLNELFTWEAAQAASDTPTNHICDLNDFPTP